ncbi:hypothetical protein [Moraxella boevrei]|uniref:hypothetical protein n=1 Tax=Faucicola boevrei TaxID=346665 RepID=UPI0037368B2E
MKLCICISGQLRGQYKSLASIHSQLDELKKYGIETTIILSVWDKKSRKLDGALFEPQLLRIFDKDLLSYFPHNITNEKIWSFIPRTYDSIKNDETEYDLFSDLSKLFPNAIIDIEKEILRLQDDSQPDYSDKNSMRMLYKKWRANEIKRQLEIKGNFKFDCVLHIRPDLIVKIVPILLKQKNFEKNSVYLDVLPKLGLGDIYAYGSSEAIDIYCKIFSLAVQNPVLISIHTLYKKYFDDNNLIAIQAGKEVLRYGLDEQKITLYDIKDETEYFSIMKLSKTDEKIEKLLRLSKELKYDKAYYCAIQLYLANLYYKKSDLNKATECLLIGYLSNYDLSKLKGFTRNKIISILLNICYDKNINLDSMKSYLIEHSVDSIVSLSDAQNISVETIKTLTKTNLMGFIDKAQLLMLNIEYILNIENLVDKYPPFPRVQHDV